MKRVILLFISVLLITGCGCSNKSLVRKHRKFFNYTFDSYDVSTEENYRCPSSGKKDCINYTIKYKDIDGNKRSFVFNDESDNLYVKVYDYMVNNILTEVRAKILSYYFNVSEKSDNQPDDVGPSSIYVYAPTKIENLKDKILSTEYGIKLSDYRNKDFFMRNKLYFALNISSEEEFLRNELDLYLDAIVSDLSNYMGYKINMVVNIYGEDFANTNKVDYKFFVNGQKTNIKVKDGENVYKVFEKNI